MTAASHILQPTSQALTGAGRLPPLPEVKPASQLKRLAMTDFQGAAPAHAVRPELMPLNAPQVKAGGRFRQVLAEQTKLKPLVAGDRVTGTKTASASAGDVHERLTRQAERWVAQTFYGTLLKQMHDSPFKASWLDGGRGGQAFQPMMDQRLVDHMARSSGHRLVQRIVRQIEGNRAYPKQQQQQGTRGKGEARQQETRNDVAAGVRA